VGTHRNTHTQRNTHTHTRTHVHTYTHTRAPSQKHAAHCRTRSKAASRPVSVYLLRKPPPPSLSPSPASPRSEAGPGRRVPARRPSCSPSKAAGDKTTTCASSRIRGSGIGEWGSGIGVGEGGLGVRGSNSGIRPPPALAPAPPAGVTRPILLAGKGRLTRLRRRRAAGTRAADGRSKVRRLGSHRVKG